uniref:Putative malate dehydrogenase n=3 Tax=Juniperus TaxID=13100 RepID=A0A5S9BMS0_9CONI|nr:putative malate dehydrogenase [Juniperus seravschanica]BBG06305.1 putative malate dehydrogenase [Juniperus polycarpos var. polycarpos]BBG06330.1 putative malate dehydrogenase [Juniperus excelsa]BBG06260.1 putative malate dehydrogenase [Juniperus seravschanica]BBG06265.1 putative malate dehydrogenase [Juniperus seravschanica]
MLISTITNSLYFYNLQGGLQLFYHLNDCNTLQGTWVSMGVYSDGSYDVPSGVIFSYPVTCENGKWSIVQGNS